MENNKIFDDFPTIRCDECELYYINQCDGADVDHKKCTSFIAVRGSNIPLQIEKLQRQVKTLSFAVFCLSLVVAIYYIMHFGG